MRKHSATRVHFAMSACNTGLATAKTSVQTSQTKTVGANGASVITTTYYTTFEQVISTGGKSLSSKASTSTNSAGKVSASQTHTVATPPKQSVVATTGFTTVPKLPIASVQTGIQASPVSDLTKATTISTVSSTGSDIKQGELGDFVTMTNNNMNRNQSSLRL